MTDEDRLAQKVLSGLERRRKAFKRTVLAQMDQARKELKDELTSGRDTVLTPGRSVEVMNVITRRVNKLERELAAAYQSEITQVVRTEGKNASALLQVQGIEITAKLPQPLLNILVEEAQSTVKALSQEVQTSARRSLTQFAIREESTFRAARGILNPGVSVPGIKPVFASVNHKAAAAAVTELVKAANVSHLHVYSEALKDYDGEVEWVAMAHACKCGICHRELNGQRRKPGEPFKSSHGSWVCPPAHPHCMCILVPRFTRGG